MSKIKVLPKSATVAWSATAQHSDLIAAGTAAGTIGLDFDTSSQLEIYSLDIKDSSTNMTLVGKTSASNRFHKLVWGAASGTDRTHGILAGGMDNGAVCLWDPAKIVAGKEETVLGSAQKHQGVVQALDFNPFQANLLASGATDSEILIWDLSNPSNPSVYTPGTKPHQTQTSDVSCIAWNKKVPHILASSTHSGTTFIWNLKEKRSIINFTDATKSQVRAITWNPQEATQILTASEDDQSPILQLWDLRNIYTPIRKYVGHKLGIWGVSWCPFDNSLIVSCGKDNRTLAWHAETAEVLCEVESGDGSNVWNVDVQWSPKTPAVLSTTSLAGVNIIALQDVGERNTAGAPVGDFGVASQPPTQASLRHAPSWLRRPVGVAFGFGGKLATFSHNATTKKSTLKVRSVVTEGDLLARSERLEEVVNTGAFEAFCDEKIASTTAEGEEKYTWKFLKVLFDKDGRHKILDYLGFDETQTAKELQSIADTLPKVEGEEEKVEEEAPKEEEKVATPEPERKEEETEAPAEEEEKTSGEETTPSEGGDRDVTGLFGAGGDSFDFSLKQPEQTEEKKPEQAEEKKPVFKAAPVRPLVPISLSTSTSGPESAITKALLVGNFEAAVDVCLRLGRTADALVLAACGGEELWARTQARYFASQKAPYTRVMASIVRNDLHGLVEQADLADWKAALAILCTYAKSSELPKLATLLGDRLDVEAHNIKAATLCYICAGSIDKTVNVWIRTTKDEKDPHQALQDLMEKVSIFRHAVNVPDNELDELLARKYCEYAEILASQGRLPASFRYLSFLSEPKYSNTGGAVLLDRVFNSFKPTGIAPPPFPFQKAEVGLYKTEPLVQTPVVPVQPPHQPLHQLPPHQTHQLPHQPPHQPPHHQLPPHQHYQQPPPQNQPGPLNQFGVPGVPKVMVPGPPMGTTGYAAPPPSGPAPSFQQPPPMGQYGVPLPSAQPVTSPPPVHAPPPITSYAPPPVSGGVVAPPPTSTAVSPPPVAKEPHHPPHPHAHPHPHPHTHTPPPIAAANAGSVPPPVATPPPPAQTHFGQPSGGVPPPTTTSAPPPATSVAPPAAAARPAAAPSTNTDPEVRFVIDTFNRALSTPLAGSHKAKWDDMSKRLPSLIALLDKGECNAASVQLLHKICKALESADYQTASASAMDLSDCLPGKDLVAVKRFVEVTKLRG